MISVEISVITQKQIKDLKKKYYSIPDDLLNLINEIIADPEVKELGLYVASA